MTSRDVELLRQWSKEGDAQAFDALVTAYANMVFGTCRRVLRDDTEASDATQECFLRLAQSATDIRTSLPAWLHTVATRESLKILRSNRRRRTREQAYSEIQAPQEANPWSEIESWVDQAIEALPKETREPLIGSFLQRKTHQQIADEMHVERSTISRRIERAIDEVRQTLKKRGVPVSGAQLVAFMEAEPLYKAPAAVTSSLAKIGIAGYERAVAVLQLRSKGRLADLVWPAAPMSVTLGGVAAVVIVLLALLGSWRFTGSTDNESEPIDNADRPAVSATVTTIPTELPIPTPTDTPKTVTPAVEAAPAQPLAISGRVVDKSTSKGIPGVSIRAEGESGIALPSSRSDADGYFVFNNVEAGDYALSVDPIDEFPESQRHPLTRVGLRDGSAAPPVEIRLNRGAVVEGQAIYMGVPLARTNIRLFSFQKLKSPLSSALPNSVTTDENGRFRVTGLKPFDGEIIGKVTRTDGTRQDSVPFPITLEYNKTFEVRLDFTGGGSTVEGNVFLGTSEHPLEASLEAFFTWEDAGEYKEDVFRNNTGEDGHFRFEGLPQGKMELHVNYSGARYITNIDVPGNTQVNRDIVISETLVLVHVTNKPPDSVFVVVLAFEGDVAIEMKSISDFLQLRDNTKAASDHLVGNDPSPINARLAGLKPGIYTITAMGWPTNYNMSEVQEYGLENFFRDIHYARTIVTIGKQEEAIEIELPFP